MEIEAFKISCRAIYPDCIFYDRPDLGIVEVYTNKNGWCDKRIALLETDIFVNVPSVVTKSESVPCGNVFIRVKEENFIHDLATVKKNGLL